MQITMITLAILWLFCSLATPSLAQKSKIRQEKPTRTSSNKSYRSCRKAAVAEAKKLKSKRHQVRFLKQAASRCRERHPAVSILTDCKRNAIRAYKDDRDYLPVALKECKEKYQSFLFQPDESLPFRVDEGRIFFAGVGLNSNREVKPSSSKEDKSDNNDIGNFDCESLGQTFGRHLDPQFLLFGNDPRSYIPLKQTSKRSLLRGLKVQTKKKMEVQVNPYLGQVYWHRQSKSVTNYFPSASCSYGGENQGLYDGIKIYYLIDLEKNMATPYFGIAFYRKGTNIPVSQLIEEVKTKLGEGYVTSKSKSGLDLVAKAEIKRFDHEGDPRNLCQFPRKHRVIGAVAADDSGQFAAYTLLSNIGNLCKYGDRFASRLLKKGFN
ncbi:hypothetical protein [Pseudobacteriovorax antillogorgiicola]|nr:hypothetical protein [Pseudobacteriovorax antillogorgiicola]